MGEFNKKSLQVCTCGGLFLTGRTRGGGCGLAWPRPRGRSGRVTHAQGRLSRGGRGRKARKVRPASPWPRWAGAAPPSPAALRDPGAPDTGTAPRPHSPPGHSAARGRGRRRGRAGRSEGPQARGSLTPGALTARPSGSRHGPESAGGGTSGAAAAGGAAAARPWGKACDKAVPGVASPVPCASYSDHRLRFLLQVKAWQR